MDRPSCIEQNVSLKQFNWWKVGGSAEYYGAPATVEEVQHCVSWAKLNNVNILVLGDGSNCLIDDDGVSGLVIHTHKLTGILQEEVQGEEYKIVCLSGTPKMTVMQAFLKQKLTPALFLSGLPGQVGGGVVMNAGVREAREPREFHEIVESLKVVDLNSGNVKTISHDDIKWSYRKTSGWQPGVLVEVTLSWPLQPDAQVPKLVVEANKMRKSKQPLEYPSGGSTFKNPSEGPSAGALIEKSGLKGFSIGGAQVSEKHANFVINTGGATSQDIAQVIQHVQDTVKQQQSTALETEVIFFGK